MGRCIGAELADFLRRRRAARVPQRPGSRRVTGLRREEVAELAHISTDYYTRLEQRRGPRPSESVADALATALGLTKDERDHLYVLVGHNPPAPAAPVDEVDPALRTVLDSIDDKPALITSNLGHTLAQNTPARTLFGDQTHYRGHERSGYYRWFLSPAERERYPADIHEQQSRIYAAALRAALDSSPEAAELITELTARSPEFALLWADHEVHICGQDTTSLLDAGGHRLDFTAQVVFGAGRGQKLLVLTR